MYWILIAVILTGLFYFYLIKPLRYWSRKGVQQKSIFGQWGDLVRIIFQLEPSADIMRDGYNYFSNKRYGGGYQFLSPVLLIRDPDLIRQITVKDFDHFLDHLQFFPEELEPLLSKNLVSLKGDKWRDMRATLSPSFTSSKMKAMFVLMNDIAKQFINHFKEDNTTQTIDMKDAFTRYANDVIASASFGIECDSLKDRNNEFYLMGKEATNLRGFWRNLSMFFMVVAPKIAKVLGIRMFSLKISNFFRRLVMTNIQSREKNGIVRPDMIHLLMEARNGRLKYEDQSNTLDAGFAIMDDSFNKLEMRGRKPQLMDDDLTAQALIFFFAGFENISNVSCFAVYELAVNPEIQDTLRREVDETLKNCNGSLTYEGLLKMKYMDMVVTETLRKWPGAVVSDRVCVKPYTIQPATEEEKPIYIEKGETLVLPIYGIHRDPHFYPNPDRFDPDRFSDENKGNIYPYSYIPFGAGPRICIGNRFALLEIKTILFHVLSHFIVDVTDETNVPLKIANDQFSLFSANGFWFKLKPRST